MVDDHLLILGNATYAWINLSEARLLVAAVSKCLGHLEDFEPML